MMHYTIVQALGQARLAELHDQARRDSLARAARRARQHHTAHRAPRLPAALGRWARRAVPGQPVPAPARRGDGRRLAGYPR